MSTDPYQRRVKDVVSREIVCVNATETVHDALALMVENRIAALPVIDKQGGCQGILSATDVVEMTLELDDDLRDYGRTDADSHQWIVEKLAEHDMDRRKVHEVMTSSVATVGLEAPLAVAAREMLRHRVHRLPVVDDQEKLIGIISTMDILTAFADGAPPD